MTNYDRLILELWTDGTITPEMALVEASKVYRKHLNPFIQFFDVGKELAIEAPSPLSAMPAPEARPVVATPASVAAAAPTSLGASSISPSAPSAPPPAPATGEDLRSKLERPISALDLSVRAGNSLESEGIQTVGELVSRTVDELLALKNFGRTSLKEIQKKLEDWGLALGMNAGVRGGQS
jgi:DNA-directed RNA polymerase subunit alpha